MRKILLSAMTAGLLAACGSDAPEQAAPDQAAVEDAAPDFADASEIGPSVGTTMPDIALKNEDGSTVQPANLASGGGGDASSNKGSVLFFVRSADWCPYCKKQLQDLAPLEDELAALGYSMAAISYDPPSTLSDFAEQHDLPYPLLSDQGSKLIDALELRDPQYPDGFAAGVPYPTVLVLDNGGTIIARTVAKNFRVRPDNGQILKLVKEANPTS